MPHPNCLRHLRVSESDMGNWKRFQSAPRVRLLVPLIFLMWALFFLMQAVLFCALSDVLHTCIVLCTVSFARCRSRGAVG